MEVCYCCCDRCNNGILWLRLPFIKLNINSYRNFCCMTYKMNRSVWLRLPVIFRYVLPHYKMNPNDYD